MLLVGIVRGRDDTASHRGFMELHFNPLRFFLHSNPPKFADEMKNFHRRLVILRGGDFSTLQIGVHRFPPSIEAKKLREQFLAIARSSSRQMGIGT